MARTRYTGPAGVRSVWTGHLRMAALTVPVKTYTAASSDAEVHLRQLCPECHAGLHQSMSCPTHGPVGRERIERGYQASAQVVVPLSEELIASCDAPSSKLADVTTFVRRAWGHTSSTLTAEEIARIRSATIERVEPWSAAELQAVQ